MARLSLADSCKAIASRNSPACDGAPVYNPKSAIPATPCAYNLPEVDRIWSIQGYIRFFQRSCFTYSRMAVQAYTALQTVVALAQLARAWL